eukprot:477401-Prymnesium_polylepis.2
MSCCTSARPCRPLSASSAWKSERDAGWSRRSTRGSSAAVTSAAALRVLHSARSVAWQTQSRPSSAAVDSCSSSQPAATPS